MPPVSLEESICRKAALDVLAEYQAGSPEEIDLETLAWIGERRLLIKEGDLDGAEGRLVATKDGGIIRIRTNIASEGRKRFTIAHEIGHRVLHGLQPFYDTLADLRTWIGSSKETEANYFASELLMPEFLLKPHVSESPPSLSFIDSLADIFKTSNLAAMISFLRHTNEPCALVVSKDGNYKWSRKSDSFDFFIKGDKLHHYTGASEIWEHKIKSTEGMGETPAGAWIDGYEPDDRDSIMEDSRLLESTGITVSLLWIHDELS